MKRDDLTEADFVDRERVSRQEDAPSGTGGTPDNFHEVNYGFSEDEAVSEAKRCLECGCHDYFECSL